jgi:hypothetical protein
MLIGQIDVTARLAYDEELAREASRCPDTGKARGNSRAPKERKE